MPPATATRLSVVLVGGIAIALLVTLVHSHSVDSSETNSSDRVTTTLLSGDNFVGWVDEPLPVDELFDDIPEIELVYRWNPSASRYDYAMPGVDLSAEPLVRIPPESTAVISVGAEPLAIDALFLAAPDIVLVYHWDALARRWLFALRYISSAHWTLDVLQSGTSATVRTGAGSQSAATLFEAAPQIVSMHQQDPAENTRSYALPGLIPAAGGLDVVQPGMSVMIRLGGHEPVEWERPHSPAAGTVRLLEGENWVSWVGRDGSKLEQVTKGIGRALISAQHGDALFEAASPDNAASRELVNRGDPLKVTVSQSLNWLQPTYATPTIEFPEGASAQLQGRVREDVRSVLEFYGQGYGVQADAFALKIVVSNDRCGWAAPTGRLLVVGTSTRCRNVRYTLSHEYFHVLQMQLSATPRIEPQWMVEGTALWAEARHAMSDGQQGHFNSLRHRAMDAASRGPDLDGFDPPYGGYGGTDPYPGYMYVLGYAAVDLLLGREDVGDLLEFYRNLGSESARSGVELGVSRDWESAFLDTYGVSVDDFYDDFDDWRSGLPGRISYRGEAGDRLIAGRVLHRDRTPVSEAMIFVYHEEGGWPRGIETGASGSFSVYAPAAEEYKAIIALPLSYACHSGHASGRFLVWRLDAEILVEFTASELHSTTVVLPFDRCP